METTGEATASNTKAVAVGAGVTAATASRRISPIEPSPHSILSKLCDHLPRRFAVDDRQNCCVVPTELSPLIPTTCFVAPRTTRRAAAAPGRRMVNKRRCKLISLPVIISFTQSPAILDRRADGFVSSVIVRAESSAAQLEPEKLMFRFSSSWKANR